MSVPANITNNPDLKFSSIESEQFRIYTFDEGREVRIDNPVALNVSASGGHRVLDAAGVSHYIPKGFYHIRWTVKDGQPNFVI